MITEDEVIKNAWQVLENAIINDQGQPIGVLAAQEVQDSPLNYDQCFTRDFAVAALAFLMQGKTDVVRNFLCQIIELQNHQKQMDCFQPSQGLMPASFKVDSR